MRIRSRQLGKIDVEEDDLLLFPEGLVGFEKYREFVHYRPEKDRPFSWLVSINDPDLAFAIADPALFMTESYQLTIGEAEEDRLDLQEDDAIEVFVILSKVDRTGTMTANLKGPIVANRRSGRAKQLLLYSGRYAARQPIRFWGQRQGLARSRKPSTVVRTVRRRAA